MKIKKFILLAFLIVPFTFHLTAQDMDKIASCAGVVVGNASVGELEGIDAKKVIMNGEVLGVQLLDERYSKLLGVEAGTFFSVKLGGEIYNCFHTLRYGFFCESLD